MSEFSISDAVELFNQQTTLNYGLWTVFVAVIFAFSAFGDKQRMGVWYGIIITVAFLAFTISNIWLIYKSITIQDNIRADISAYLAAPGAGVDPKFKKTLAALTERGFGPILLSCVVHFIIDAAAIYAFWHRVRASRANESST